ncbi:sensor histidine kinase [Sporosalibacterium faouarense]|uniref:sensor histidine kinase n=1 Tax=Sporosalibacterium faouarense TaxID=516123 RepID=UPI00141D20B6|nr:HAMP domain-containing sensor histidine kinase [Sporosalibacterium faouarense]MTI47368.1 HAMP domain-containing protein [Bacillota bacterium]
MRKSIRYRLFWGISLFIIIIIGLSWILNTKLLDKYYLYKEKEMITESVKDLDDYYGSINNDILVNKLEELENKLNANIFIYSNNGETRYTTYNIRGRGMNSPWNIRLSKLGEANLANGKTVFEIQKHTKLQTEFLVMGYQLNNSDILLVQVPMAAVAETLKVANDFYLYIAIFSIIIGGIISFYFSKKFTKPIVELNRITKDIANLDFSKKSDIRSEDEIGELAENINVLSFKLDNTINNLNLANTKLQEDIEKERRIDKMRKEFISNVSHELKTPISLIKGYSEGLKDNVAEDKESRGFYCDVIIDEASKMDNLVKDLLHLSKIESGHLDLKEQSFDICKLTNEVLMKYEPIFQEKAINLKANGFKAVNVMGDKGKIERVLKNYINNAIDHTINEKDIIVGIYEEMEEVKVSVFNTGKTIPEEEIDNLWDSFYKLDKARSRKYGGTGLGLAIVKGIIKLHDGKLGVDNKKNGVEFWFKIKKDK